METKFNFLGARAPAQLASMVETVLEVQEQLQELRNFKGFGKHQFEFEFFESEFENVPQCVSLQH
jgi:hypothetical protein